MFTDTDRQDLKDVKHVLSRTYGEPDLGRNFGDDRIAWDGKLDAILAAVTGGNSDAIIAEIRAQGEASRAALVERLAELAPALAGAVAEQVDHTLDVAAAAEAIRQVLRSV